ncbi:recombinase family protein [Pseudohalocynthiibacter sp. F2068]|uniref:recombinase family protein n=1 Tax=Pseudohalocynthiibacter sp. F2068 TaxID=2926418 RepID=UPI001FF537C9|nr:recombinase family protein [Pseudohalocynthiibacter sp. F2068]MCK0104386.1 recombinase family protein [Pseudohalocynthiibacter sp. F2068]
MLKKKCKAFAYLRTSSAANVGADKDSDQRQRDAISTYADRAGITIEAEFYDAAVSGADLIEERPGFAALLERIDGNGVRIILIEDPSRFARSMRASVLGEMLLKSRGVMVICANGEQLFDHEDEMRQAMSQIAMVFSELEKTRLVRKLAKARDRKSVAQGRRVEGRKPVPETTVKEATRLYRKSPKTGKRRSLREIAEELEILGLTPPSGKAYNPNSVRQMLERAAVYQPA